MSDELEVVIAPEIEDDVRALLTWWREHRPGAPEPLERELREALLALARWPRTSTRVKLLRRSVHRVVLDRTGYLVFYTYEVSARRATVVLVRRGHRRPAHCARETQAESSWVDSTMKSRNARTFAGGSRRDGWNA